MGMSIQDILKAQQRAASATRKFKPAPFRKTEPKAGNRTVQDLLKAQQTAASATRKAPVATAAKPEPNSNVAELIERQRVTAAAQKAATSGISPVLSSNQKAVVDAIREQYKKFLAKLDKELAGQELRMTPPPVHKAPVDEKPAPTPEPEPIFTPNVPGNMEVVIEPQVGPSDVNGISVGEEMGGQVAVSARPKRKRRTKPAKQEATAEEPAVEEPAVEA